MGATVDVHTYMHTYIPTAYKFEVKCSSECATVTPEAGMLTLRRPPRHPSLEPETKPVSDRVSSLPSPRQACAPWSLPSTS